MIPRLFLCTDLDRTLLPNGSQPESVFARKTFRRLSAQPELMLSYVTGRYRLLVERAIRLYQLPVPDFVIADVGSTIYQIEHGVWQHVQEWDDRIGNDWAGKTHADLKNLFTDIRALRLQERSKQNINKLSYYVSLYTNHETLMAMMQSRLDAAGIRASLIWSIDEMASVGLLDVLPASATKRGAIEFLMHKNGFTYANTIFAGDSGNDLPVLTSPIHAVLVANASDAVRKAAQQEADNAGLGDALYMARGGFRQMNGNYSAGILEGLVHYMPEVETWLDRAMP
jgi:hypothetical protein